MAIGGLAVAPGHAKSPAAKYATEAATGTTTGTAGPKSAPVKPPARLAGVNSWAYQLQNVRAWVIAKSPYDLIVVDALKGAPGGTGFSERDIAKMKKGKDGRRRFVLAYLSIGEAEDYRFYWNPAWVESIELHQPAEAPAPRDNPLPPSAQATGSAVQAAPAAAPAPAAAAPAKKPARLRIPKLTAPTWLGRENKAWSGNFEVRYWDPSWQGIIFGSPRSYLERIIAAGFDGIYIDRVDAYYALIDERPSAEQDMASFVIALARHARKLNPDFVVVPQNAEELLLKPEYLAEIDGIAKEDLFYGSDGEGEPNPGAYIRNSLGWLGAAKPKKLPVFVIEYLQDPVVLAAAEKSIRERNFIPYFGPRGLDSLTLPEDWKPYSAPPAEKSKAPARKKKRRAKK